MSDLPVVFGPAQLTLLALAACKFDLQRDFAGALLRWELSPQVGDIVKALTSDQIQSISSRGSLCHLIRLARGDSSVFWSDLHRSSLANDERGIDLSIVSALFRPAPVDRSVASA